MKIERKKWKINKHAKETGRKMNEQINAKWKKNELNSNDFQRETKGKLMEHERNQNENLMRIQKKFKGKLIQILWK